MKRQASSKSSLFLLEMTISILFFSIAAAICMQAVVKTHTLSEEAGKLNMAQAYAASAAEQLAVQEEIAPVFYDGGWLPCEEPEAVFRMDIEVSEKEQMRTGEICVSECGGEEIYRLTASYYVPQTGKGDGNE